MPELPDVAAFGQIADKYGLNKVIRQIKLFEPAMAKGLDEEILNQKFAEHQFSRTLRHGKHLLLGTDTGWLALHFGMSGGLASCHDEQDMPRHTRMVVIFDNDCLAYTSQRKLGKIELTSSPEDFIKEKDLGPDAMEMKEDDFINLLKNKRGMIKTALMDQSALAGIGNEYSDEILYQAGIHPRSSTGDLKEEDLRLLYQKTREILPRAQEFLFKEEHLPEDWLISHRRKGTPCPRCGGKIEKEKIGGRSSYFCPNCQQEKKA